MKRILIITNNLNQASYRLRVGALLGALRERGFEFDVQVRPRNIFARRKLLRSSREYDAVLLQRKLLDPRDARLLRQSARRIVFDVDDAVMFDEKPGRRFSQWRITRRFDATASILDCAVVGNEYLARIFLKKTRNVIVLPTVVDPAHYKIKEHAESSVIRLVWVGSHSTLPYLEAQLPAIERAAEEVKDLRLVIIADATLSSTKISVEHYPWSEESEADLLARGDIGIAPTPLNHWTLGKCGFKIVQYMAAGLPTVASPVGANAQIVQHEKTGFLVENSEDWVKHIVRLARDVELRRRMGHAARARVESLYSLTRAVQTWTQVLSI